MRHKHATKEGHPPERSALKSTSEPKEGGRGAAAGWPPAAATGQVGGKKISKNVTAVSRMKKYSFKCGDGLSVSVEAETIEEALHKLCPNPGAFLGYYEHQIEPGLTVRAR